MKHFFHQTFDFMRSVSKMLPSCWIHIACPNFPAASVSSACRTTGYASPLVHLAPCALRLSTKCTQGPSPYTSGFRTLALACRQLKEDTVPTVAYSDSFGEGGSNGTLGYYLASAFDQIYVQETGLVSFTGQHYHSTLYLF